MKRQHQIDKAAVRELILFAQNNSKQAYKILIEVYLPNFQKKALKGIFDKQLAIKALGNYYYAQVRVLYKKEFRADIQLNPAERAEFGAYFLAELWNEYGLKSVKTKAAKAAKKK
jgi:predicted TIM-barrel fold metal-dependent hydrolase